MPQPPEPARRPVESERFGDRRIDVYAWLRDRDDPAVIEHLRAENAYSDALFAEAGDTRARLLEEIVARVEETDATAPVPHGPWEYVTRTEAGRQHPIHVRRPRGCGAEEVVLDENALAAGYEHCSVGDIEVSPDHSRLAYTVDHSGGERYTLHVEPVGVTGAPSTAGVDDVYYGVAWASDGSAVLHTRPDAAMRPYQVWLHRPGGDPGGDVLVLEERDERFFVSLERSRDERWIVITLESRESAEVWLVDAGDVAAPARRVAERREHVDYRVVPRGAELWILTNEGAPDFRLMRARVRDGDGDAAPASTWEEVVPGVAGDRLVDVDTFAGGIVLSYRHDALRELRVLDPATGAVRAMPQADQVYAASIDDTPEFEASEVRVTYTTPDRPRATLYLDLATLASRAVKVDPVRGGFDAADYVAERLWVDSAGGARVPVDTVRHRDTPLDGSAPLLLYGYGAYEVSIDADFRVERLPLLDRGCIHAIAHIRGGGELGRGWWEDGRLAAKHHTFDDFAACAQALVDRGFTSPDRLAIRGRSAGGLLIGATLNLRPELFAAAIAHVPFVDALTTMLDPTLPLTVVEYEEWGNPETPEGYAWIRGYSPYDNVRAAPYPAVLATVGLNDPRVGYWEAAKWIARLRECSTSGRPVQLVTDLHGGHAGASGRYERWREEALVHAFLLRELAGFRCAAVSPRAAR